MAQAAIGKRAYLYYFTHEPPTAPGQPNLRATHTAEIPYVFNNLKAVRVYPDTSSPELSSASAADVKLADIVSSYWVNFAKTGDPNGKGLAVWPQFKDNASGRAMVLGDTQQPQTEVPSAKFALFDQLYARQMAATSASARGFDPLVATRTVSPAAASPTVVPVLAAISFSHLLNDTIQSLLPAIYPILKSSYQLSFSQVGLMTLTLMVTASVLQPIVGLYTDRRATPYSLVFGMTFSLLGLLLLSVAGHLGDAAVWRRASSAWARRSFIPSRRASRAWRRADATASRSRCFRSAATSARRSVRCSPRSSSCRAVSRASRGPRASRCWRSSVLWKVGGWSSAQHRVPRPAQPRRTRESPSPRRPVAPRGSACRSPCSSR